MKSVILAIVGFFVSAVAVFRWGKASADKEIANREKNESIRKDQNFKKIMSNPPVDNPFSRMRKKN